MKFPSKFAITLKANTIAPVLFTLEFNGTEVAKHDCATSQHIYLEHEFDDTEPISHCYKLIMTGKKHNDDIHDFVAEVTSVFLDYLDITKFYSTTGLNYVHDQNGYGPEQTQRFHYYLGCDGYILFPFASPAYQWIHVITTPNHGY